MRTTYNDLPPECLLRIIAFLHLPDVATLLQTSRLWNSVITENEETVYRQLVKSCDSMDVPLGSLEDAIKGWASQEARKVQSWKQYCQLQVGTKRRWHGKGKAYSTCDMFGSAQQTEAHRIKIDTEKSLLVMTGEGESADEGCLVVHCLRDPGREALFRLDEVSVYAHVEMSNGFVVFTCGGSDELEVWRWAGDQDDDPLDREPTEQQLSMHESAVESAGFQPESSHRGELVPMGMLKHPAELRASRLAYPTLCVGSRAGDRLWLWDIRTRSLTQTINLEPSPYHLFCMLYVDVNETHAFVATQTVSVYSRASGQCVFQLPELHRALLSTCVDSPPTTAYGSVRSCVFEERKLLGYHDPNLQTPFHHPDDVVMAVHVSPAGDDFVAITYRGFILHISGLKSRVAENEATTRDASGLSAGHDLSLAPQPQLDPNNRTPPSSQNLRVSIIRAERHLSNLAYDGRKALVYGNQGLCLIHLEEQPSEIFEISPGEGPAIKSYPFPSNSIYRVPPFGSEQDSYGDCSCLQMTQDSFWVAWLGESLPVEVDQIATHQKVVGMMDFTRATLNDF